MRPVLGTCPGRRGGGRRSRSFIHSSKSGWRLCCAACRIGLARQIQRDPALARDLTTAAQETYGTFRRDRHRQGHFGKAVMANLGRQALQHAAQFVQQSR